MVSTTTNPFFGMSWSGSVSQETVLFEIVLPKGAKKALRGFNLHEQEVLLDHDSKFQVLSIRKETTVNAAGNTIVLKVLRLLYLE